MNIWSEYLLINITNLQYAILRYAVEIYESVCDEDYKLISCLKEKINVDMNKEVLHKKEIFLVQIMLPT